MRERVDDSAPFAFSTRHNWTGALLVHAVDDIDCLGEHFYGYPNLVIHADKQAFVEAMDPLEHRVCPTKCRVTLLPASISMYEFAVK